MSWSRLESPFYWTLFAGAFLAMAVWESARAERSLITAAGRRWSMHALLLVVGASANTLLLRVTPVFAAVAAEGNSWGLLNRSAIPFWIRAVVTVLVLDFVKYAVHWLMHHVSWLWRIHTVHHSDPDFDVSTAARAHPLEIVTLQAAILGAVVLLAAPPSAVLAAELIAVFFSFFEHANASLPEAWDRRLRRWFITPDVHRIHHSERLREQYHNLGEIFSWWDRLLGTFQEEPTAGKQGLVVGIRGYQTPASLGLGFMLTQPFLPLPEQQESDERIEG